MNRFETKDVAEAQQKLNELQKNPKHAIDAYELEDGTIRLTWIERSNYVAQDGKEYIDEVWMTKEGDLIQIQDLSEAHAKNILRMMLRTERENRIMRENFLAQLQDAFHDAYATEEFADDEIGEATVTDVETGKTVTSNSDPMEGFSISGDSFYVQGSDKLQ